ncbi:hypothetical protein HIM_03864 [Hirsutella minnesotensis 3608]|uniref:Uncharacterized protein n=1 Tax=Hirsutella minnesotensis 3608 TaxID=1043627 RepID=A0A0F8A2F5_9HYPO|nr:hypothetical protein HIM_03864 [Hirsutella minnesotensis 3608]
MSRFDWTPLRVAVGSLRYHGVSVCVGGEAAFAYFNSLFVDYDDPDDQGPVLELIVSDEWFPAATGILCSSGLFQPLPSAPDSLGFDGGWRALNGFPHLKTTGWCSSLSAIAIVPGSCAGINPEDRSVFVEIYDAVTDKNFGACLDLQGLSLDAIKFLPWPRLPVFMRSLPKRLGKPANPVASADDDSDETAVDLENHFQAAVEDLVDGMNISLEWVYRHVNVQDPELAARVRQAVNKRFERLDWMEPGNRITRAIKNTEHAEVIALIPGHD